MASLNRCEFIGRMGKDVDLRYSAQGKAIANFSLACSENWKDKNSGERKEKTEWINIVAFGKLAEIMGQYLSKGSQIFVSGKFTTEKYTDRNGIEKYATKIIANEMVMLDSKNQTAVNQGASTARQQQNEPAKAAPAPQNDDFDQDIPF